MRIKLTLLFTALSISSLTYAQHFKGNVSGALGILNPKVRVQYEIPIKDRASYGMNINYYLLFWKGPVFEPFIRLYGKKDGNAEGPFGQIKLIYGNLSTMAMDDMTVIDSRRWNTYGFGVNYGYKFLLGKHFTIEPLTGLRFLSPPLYSYKNKGRRSGFKHVMEAMGWYLTTGLPLDFQLKFGYQF